MTSEEKNVQPAPKPRDFTASVAVIKCPNYDAETVAKSLHTALSYFGGIFALIKPGQKVLIKPNMLNASSPEQAVVTHPSIVVAVAKLVKQSGAIPFVGDSPAMGSGLQAGKQSGLFAMLQEIGVEMVELKTPLEIDCPNGAVCKKVTISKEITQFDALINISKYKTHGLTGYTAAIKNIFGVVPGMRKAQYHLEKSEREDFCRFIVDLAGLIQPTLNIIDMVVGMEGEGGPASGILKPMGLLLASQDIAAVDAVACEITGLPLEKNMLLQYAAEKNIGETNLNKIEVRGETIDSVRVSDFKHIDFTAKKSPFAMMPKWLLNWLKKLMLQKPVFSQLKCTRCGNCVKICPPQAIEMGRRTPEVNYNKCIRCFCCLEVCPSKAITVEKSWISKMREKLGF